MSQTLSVTFFAQSSPPRINFCAFRPATVPNILTFEKNLTISFWFENQHRPQMQYPRFTQFRLVPIHFSLNFHRHFQLATCASAHFFEMNLILLSYPTYPNHFFLNSSQIQKIVDFESKFSPPFFDGPRFAAANGTALDSSALGHNFQISSFLDIVHLKIYG
jgi:hypothetical protein